MKKKLLTALVTAAVLGTTALPAAAQNIAVVNGKAIPKTQADTIKKQLERENPGQPFPPEMEEKIKEELIVREILVQEAQKRGLGTSDDYKNNLEMARRGLLIQELINTLDKEISVSDEEVKAEYDTFAANSRKKEYKSSHILVEKEEEAKAIIESLKKKGKFEDIAKKQSKDPGSGANGGDLGWSAAESYVPEFAEALTKLEKGKTTQEPVKSQFGWHIIRLEDTRDSEPPALDEQLKNQISTYLKQKKRIAIQEDLRAKAKVE